MSSNKLNIFTKGFLKENPTFVLLLGMCAFLSSPLISNVKMEPPPFGKYFLYNLCCSGSSETDG